MRLATLNLATSRMGDISLLNGPTFAHRRRSHTPHLGIRSAIMSSRQQLYEHRRPRRLLRALPFLLLSLVLASAQAQRQTLRDTISRIQLVSPPNLVVIMCDQLRFDAIGIAQHNLKQYDGKFRIQTPNIDRLAKQGAFFDTAYCVSPSCAPARTAFKSGTTVQRNGIKCNQMVDASVYRKMPLIAQNVASIQTYEQLLHEIGYSVEYYGKWHVPYELYQSRQDPSTRIIQYNHYDFVNEQWKFAPSMSFKEFYQDALGYQLERDGVNIPFRNGQQENEWTNCPYTPIQLDARYGMRTNTPLSEEFSQAHSCGRDELPAKYSSTAILGTTALLGLDRLAAAGRPFATTISINAPHPPMISAAPYFDKYYDNRSRLFVSPSINDRMKNSAYAYSASRKNFDEPGYDYNDPEKVVELQAAYNGMIEEVDGWIGQIMKRLEDNGVANNTLVIVTSDHGEMMGSHALMGKGVLYEEAARVPLLISFPDAIKPTTVPTPVSHLDIFATIMDYLHVPYLDSSDGMSLRRFVETSSFNEDYDEAVAVVELDQRYPLSAKQFRGTLGDSPNFLIRKGDYKLIVPKKSDSEVLDMMFDLGNDPFEVNNLLGNKGMDASNDHIGKAEYLKLLLIEWMSRVDGPKQHYSNKIYNLNEGRGDIEEIKRRRTWRTVNFWKSHSVLDFGQPVLRDGLYLRNEYVYIGRTNEGTLLIDSITVEGRDAALFSVSARRASLSENESVRLRVAFRSDRLVDMSTIDATLVMNKRDQGVTRIPIVAAS